VISAHWKYRPARDLLEEEWMNTFINDDMNRAPLVADVWSVMRTSLLRLSKVTMPSWVANCGRVRGSGYLGHSLLIGAAKRARDGEPCHAQLGEGQN
jgi:hypothetical protein